MAIISRKEKICFIHINNTGGSTITTLLEDVVRDLEVFGKIHSTLLETTKQLPEVDDYYKFSYVRNPYDWLTSIFANINMNEKHPDYNTVKKLSFVEFIEWLGDTGLKRQGENNLPVYRKQTDFIFNKNRIMVNDVFKYEHLCNDTGISNAHSLFLKLGFNMPDNIPVLNKTHRTLNWDNLFNIKSYKLVNELFADDFKNFKYKNKYV